jgi:nicotinamide-nucleotide adenylyltransferase
VPRGLLVGRFQPFHRGHLALLSSIRAARPEAPLLVAVGSAEESYTWRNPFTAGERYEMIDRAVRALPLEGVEIVPLPDIRRHAQWVAYVESMLPAFDRIYSNNPLTRLLFERAGYAVEGSPLLERDRWEGAQVRARLAEDGDWRALVPPATADYLAAIDAPKRLRRLRPDGPLAPDGAAP